MKQLLLDTRLALMLILACTLPVSASDQQLTQRIADTVRAQFVDADVAAKTADGFLAKANAGAYEGTAEPETLARSMTADLRALSGDNHIGVVYDPEAVARYRARAQAASSPDAEERNTEHKARRAKEAALDNYGLRAVEVMKGGVGYLRIDEFDGHVAESETMLATVMNMLASSNAIILDLRHNVGGNSRILPTFLGYFIGPGEVQFGTSTERWNDTVTPLKTRADIQGARHWDKPLYILTSGMTFSLGEHVTYHLKALDRAILVGERTYGGGNGWDPVVLNDDFYLRIPRISFTNTRTGTLFREGEGISPDINVPAEYAKTTAYHEALLALRETVEDADMVGEINWAINIAASALEGGPEDTSALPFIGSFGPYAFRGDEHALWLSYNGHPYMLLRTLDGRVYLDDRSVPRQFTFTGATLKEAKSLTVTPYGGAPADFERDGGS